MVDELKQMSVFLISVKTNNFNLEQIILKNHKVFPNKKIRKFLLKTISFGTIFVPIQR